MILLELSDLGKFIIRLASSSVSVLFFRSLFPAVLQPTERLEEAKLRRR